MNGFGTAGAANGFVTAGAIGATSGDPKDFGAPNENTTGAVVDAVGSGVAPASEKAAIPFATESGDGCFPTRKEGPAPATDDDDDGGAVASGSAVADIF